MDDNIKYLFDEKYTGRFKLTKALTFELAPYGKTDETIRRNGWVEADAAKIEMIRGARPLFDEFILANVSESMSNLRFDWDVYAEACDLREELPDRFRKEKDRLSKEIVSAILDTMGISKAQDMLSKSFIYGEKDNDTGKVISYFKKKGRSEDAERLLSISAYMPIIKRTLTSRCTAVESWIPERIIENFDIYMKNVPLIKAFLKSDFSRTFHDDFEEECDSFRYFSGYALCLDVDGIRAYNNMICGIISEEGIVKKGLNSRIQEANNEIKTKKLKMGLFGKTDKLKKQILAPTERQFTIDRIENDTDLREMLFACTEAAETLAEDLADYFTGIDKEDAANMLFDGRNAHSVSFLVVGDHNLLPSLLIEKAKAEIEAAYEGANPTQRVLNAKRKRLQLVEDTVNKSVYSLGAAKEAFLGAGRNDIAVPAIIIADFRTLCRTVITRVKELRDVISDCDTAIKGNERSIKSIRMFFDACTDLRKRLKLFVPKNKTSIISVASDSIKDFRDSFYAATNRCNNMARNYIVKKTGVAASPQQIFFNEPAKLDGKYWNGMDVFAKNNNGIINMDDMYYLFMLCPGEKPVRLAEQTDREGSVRMLSVNRLATPTKNIPRLTWTKNVKLFFETHPDANVYPLKARKEKNLVSDVTISRKAYEIYKAGSFKTDKKESLPEEEWRENLATLIETYINYLAAHKVYCHLNLGALKAPEDYADFGEFCGHVDSISTVMEWKNVSREQIENLVDDGYALMFLIRNKNMYNDTAHGSENDHKPNSYAQLFLGALSDENVASPNLRLNSRPVFWFRPASVEYRVAHKKGEKMLNKTTLDGRMIPDSPVRTELKEYAAGRISERMLSEEALGYAFVYKGGKKTDNLSYTIAPKDIIWKESLARDMYKVTFTIEINSGVERDSSYGLIEDARDFEASHGRLLSVIRNGNDLLYYTLTDRNGNVLKEGSLNVIDGVDFRKKLIAKTAEKNKEREEWLPITSADEIKSTYMRKAVHIIKKMAVDNNAKIIVEYVGAGKRSSNAMFDNQIYGKFVDLLKRGMGTYTDSEVSASSSPYKPGGRLNPLQLAFSGRGWNSGFVEEQSGAYASRMCPETGFVNLFSFRNVNTVHEVRDFFRLFKDITLYGSDTDDPHVEFTFDYSDFEEHISLVPAVTEWTLRGSGKRFVVIPSTRARELRNMVDFLGEMFDTEEPVSDLLAGVDGYDGTQLNSLLSVFRTILSGFHYKNEEGGEMTYVSPVTGKEYNSSRHASMMLAEKYRYLSSIDNIKAGEASKEWIKYMQAQRG